MKLNDFPIKEFIIGGILFSLIKYSADNISDIRVAAMIAAAPIGLISSLLIVDKKIKIYSSSYMMNNGVLFITALGFYYFHRYTKLHRHINLILSVLFWTIVNLLILYLF